MCLLKTSGHPENIREIIILVLYSICHYSPEVLYASMFHMFYSDVSSVLVFYLFCFVSQLNQGCIINGYIITTKKGKSIKSRTHRTYRTLNKTIHRTVKTHIQLLYRMLMFYVLLQNMVL